MSVSLTLCKIPRHYQFRRPTSKTLVYLHFDCIVFTCFYFFHEVMRPQWRGRGSLDPRRWSCRQAPLHLHLRRAAGVTVAFHLSLLVVEGMLGVNTPWGSSTIVAYSVESQCIIICLD